MAADPVILWTTDLANLTATEAAQRFARMYWDQPHTVSEWLGDQFRVSDGTRLYRVRPRGRGWEVVG